MYAKNISSFLVNLVKGGELRIDVEGEITRETLASGGGQIVRPRVREAFGIEPAEAAPDAAPSAAVPPEETTPEEPEETPPEATEETTPEEPEETEEAAT